MAYRCPGAQVSRGNYYSNPDVDYLEKPTGTATANCAREISENIVSILARDAGICRGA